MTPAELTQITGEGGDRYYMLGEKKYESVTTYIGRNMDKKGLVAWRKRLGEEEADYQLNRSRTRGTMLHGVIEKFLLNDADGVSQIVKENLQTRGLFAKVKPVLESRLNDISIIEKALHSDEMMLAGTADCIAKFDGEFAVVDFKSSKKDKVKKWIRHYFLQTAAYGIMYAEEFKSFPTKSVIIIAVEDNPLPEVHVEPMDRWIETFNLFRKDPKILTQEDI